MVTIDGAVDAKEWDGAAELKTPVGVARMRVAGRVLCIGLTMGRAYQGERVDLHVADPDGLNYSWHSFHPASPVPGLQAQPVAPVIVRRSSWINRGEAPQGAPYACLFRASVFQQEGSWSAEFAIDITGLDVAVAGRVMFRLEVADPAGDAAPIRFAAGGAHPSQWPRLSAVWPAKGKSLDTPDEDSRREFELELFQEFIDIGTKKKPRKPILSKALDGKKSGKLVADLLGRLDACLAADPRDFYAAFVRARVLRRANRLDDALAQLEAIGKTFPKLDRGKAPFVAEHFNLLIARGQFDEARLLPLPEEFKKRWAGVETAWTLEQFRWDSAENATRVAFETSKGRVVAEIYTSIFSRHLLKLVRDGHFDDSPLDEVTGALGAWTAAKKDAPTVASPEKTRLAWRGTIGLAWDPKAKKVGSRLLLATGHAFLSTDVAAVGRIVEGMKHADALDAGDKIVSARVLAK